MDWKVKLEQTVPTKIEPKFKSISMYFGQKSIIVAQFMMNISTCNFDGEEHAKDASTMCIGTSNTLQELLQVVTCQYFNLHILIYLYDFDFDTKVKSSLLQQSFVMHGSGNVRPHKICLCNFILYFC